MDLTLFAQTAGAVPVDVAGAEAGFSLWALFWQAHIVVKIVMIGLMVASVWSWAIIIEKLFLLVRIERRTNKFEDQFWSGRSLEDLYASMAQENNRSSAALFVAAMREWKRSQESMMRAGFIGVQQRIERAMDVEMQKEMASLESRLLFLATVGSTAPFVGLFGTVWGIMNSFRAIAISKSTNLAVVAPGIAEALFATALGLLAAIPAVIFYNKITNDISKLAVRFESFSGEFSSIISRQLDESV
ncbi:MAG: protein TolQ [Alphaproteobacteria bacterium]|nr:protein TolQ [Alphaproteobacteria bacterium]